jgi:hypothetical protein
MPLNAKMVGVKMKCANLDKPTSPNKKHSWIVKNEQEHLRGRNEKLVYNFFAKTSSPAMCAFFSLKKT